MEKEQIVEQITSEFSLRIECNSHIEIESKNNRIISKIMDFQWSICEGSTEVSIVLENQNFLLSKIDIIGWNESLQMFIRIFGSVENGLLTPMDIYVTDTNGNRIGYLMNLFVFCCNGKVSITFDRFVWDNTNKNWFARNYQ